MPDGACASLRVFGESPECPKDARPGGAGNALRIKSWLRHERGLPHPSAPTYTSSQQISPPCCHRSKERQRWFLVLSLLEHEKRHGYELNKLIESRPKGVLTFHIASLYPLLYRMEDRGWIAGRWVEKAGERRRRFYSITAASRRVLDEMRVGWLEFAAAVAQVTGVRYG